MNKPPTTELLRDPGRADSIGTLIAQFRSRGVQLWFEGDRLRYAGKVGTGFTRATLQDLAERLAPLVRETSPFEPEKGIPRAATWVEPELVAQIAFMEWTPDGRLRHPSFLGLRFDKPARDVVREAS